MIQAIARRSPRPGSQYPPLLLFIAISVLLPTSQSAMADYLYDWDSEGVRKITDPIGDTNNYGGIYKPGRDIIAAYRAFDGTYSYFRIDLAACPVIQSFEEMYGIFIDSVPGGAPASEDYVPQIPEIDLPEHRIDSIFYARFGEWKGKYRHWENGGFSSPVGVVFQHSENLGATLEWKFKGQLGSDSTWYAASMLPNSHGKQTFDYAGETEPTAGIMRRRQ